MMWIYPCVQVAFRFGWLLSTQQSISWLFDQLLGDWSHWSRIFLLQWSFDIRPLARVTLTSLWQFLCRLSENARGFPSWGKWLGCVHACVVVSVRVRMQIYVFWDACTLYVCVHWKERERKRDNSTKSLVNWEQMALSISSIEPRPFECNRNSKSSCNNFHADNWPGAPYHYKLC